MPFNFPALLLSVPKRFSLSTLENDFEKLAAIEEKKELAKALASMDLDPEELWPEWDKVVTTTSTAAPTQIPVQMPWHDRWGFGRALRPQVNETTEKAAAVTLKHLETLDRSSRRPLTAGYDPDTEVDSFWAFIHQLVSFESLLIFILAGFVLAWIFKLTCKGVYFAGAKPVLPIANEVSTTRVQGQVETGGQNQGQSVNESEPLLGHRPIIYPGRFPYDVIPAATAHAQPPDPALVQVHNYLNA